MLSHPKRQSSHCYMARMPLVNVVYQMLGCLDSDFVRGKIVICNGRDAKEAVKATGAIGVAALKYRCPDVSFIVPLPATDLISDDLDAIKNYKNSTKKHRVGILTSEPTKDKAPVVVSFSSHGPNLIVPEILKHGLWMLPKDKDAEFAYGSGHIDPVKAANPSLVYESTKADFMKFLRNISYSKDDITRISGDVVTCPESTRKKSSAKDLNYPSMAPSQPFRIGHSALMKLNQDSTYFFILIQTARVQNNIHS
ncbi:hypothetical protein Ancab_011561 [Ancistrocladus abbreviatus]